MESYDRLLLEFMRKWNVPGGAVAVVNEGRLVLARGYGWADVEAKQPVEPASLFRLASVSKPFTAVAVLKLVEQGKLKIDDRVCQLLGEFPEGEHADSRWREITVGQLLHHTGGWDRDKAYDPMFMPYKISKALGTPAPAGSAEIIRYMLREPLQHPPGERYSYSNFGYCLLGRIIERATGRAYGQVVHELVLRPCGITDMRLGHTKLAARARGEVRYYNHPDDQLVRSVFPDVHDKVPPPYGGFYIEAMDSHGGWIGSAIDMMRFVAHLEGSRQPALLEPESRGRMLARPAPPVSVNKPSWYGMGWSVRSTGKNTRNWWHNGSLDGTSTLVVRTSQGRCWAALFNTRPSDEQEKKLGDFSGELDDLLWKAADGVERWPAHDLFPRFDR